MTQQIGSCTFPQQHASTVGLVASCRAPAAINTSRIKATSAAQGSLPCITPPTPASPFRQVLPPTWTAPSARPQPRLCLGLSPKRPRFLPRPHLTVVVAVDGPQSPLSDSAMVGYLPRRSRYR